MIIDSEYNYGDIVYLTEDKEQLPGRIVGIIGRPGQIKLEVSYAGAVTEVYDFEVSRTKNYSN